MSDDDHGQFQFKSVEGGQVSFEPISQPGATFETVASCNLETNLPCACGSGTIC